MTKEKLLLTIATHGYNVGFGAKKNFASHDIVVKLPGWIGFITLAIGILQLGYTSLGCNKELSATIILVSVASLYLSAYNARVQDYDKEGIRLTTLFNRLRDLYYTVQAKEDDEFVEEQEKLNIILNELYSTTISKQVFMSQWFAHFKFFYEMQIDWVNEQLHFRFFKDKLPNSIKIFLLILIFIAIAITSYEYFFNI
jgi:hypothetical protein